MHAIVKLQYICQPFFIQFFVIVVYSMKRFQGAEGFSSNSSQLLTDEDSTQPQQE